MRALALASALAALAACEEHHNVTLLLGPNDTTLTVGFTCRDDSGDLLLGQAREGNQLVFQLVFDTFDLGHQLPGCRGEELLASCDNHKCTRIGRLCKTVKLPVNLGSSNPAATLAALHDQLGTEKLITDAPDDPIIVRAAATLQSCAELEPEDGSLPALDPARAIGCAYSCPVVLDDLRGSLGMALDTLDDRCAPQVRACAKFGP